MFTPINYVWVYKYVCVCVCVCVIYTFSPEVPLFYRFRLSVPLCADSSSCTCNPVGRSHTGPPQLGRISSRHARNKAEHCVGSPGLCPISGTLLECHSSHCYCLAQTNIKERKQSTAKSYSSHFFPSNTYSLCQHRQQVFLKPHTED